MPELSPCMRLVVRMPQADQDEVVARVDAYTNSGIPAAQAQRMAVADLIAEIDADAAELRGLAEAKQPVAVPSLSQTETPEFKRWFGDSKVVDEDGRPLVVYHGAHRDFSAFDASAPSSHIPLPGFYFTPDPGIASMFAESGAKMAENKAGRPYEPIGATVMPAYLSLQNPFEFDASEGAMKGFVSEKIIKEIILDAKRKGHDGVIIRGWRDGSGPVQYVAFRPEQIKSAIGNSGAFDPTNPDIRASLPEEPAPEAGPGFYSALRRELANAKTNASPADYWRNLIKGAVSKGLVKADEVQWSGVEDWLAAQPGKISKTDMLDLLDLRGVRVEETVLSDIGDDIPIHGSDAKYAQYTLPGGSNYREVLLTLPRKERTLAEVERDVAQREGWSLPLTGDQQRAVTLEWKQWTAEDKDYRSNHWDQPNVLAHIRVNDRVDSDGKRVLFVEEIQSDWGSETRKQREAIAKAVDSDFNGIVDRMKQAGVLEVVCD